jgi:hypothetical protein
MYPSPHILRILLGELGVLEIKKRILHFFRSGGGGRMDCLFVHWLLGCCLETFFPSLGEMTQ